MNNRLLSIAERIGPKGFVDVGTDHGYLPIYMAKRGYNGNIIASDINSDPLNCAIRNANDANVSDKIEFLLCDGLDESVKERVDTIIVAGMGGDSICGILDRSAWCMDEKYQLILQAMTKSEILRYWLSNNDFYISDEVLIEENGTVYQLISACYGKRLALSDAELFLGRLDIAKKNALFEKQLNKYLKRFDKMMKGLSASGDSQDLARYAFAKSIHNELCSIRDNLD